MPLLLAFGNGDQDGECHFGTLKKSTLLIKGVKSLLKYIPGFQSLEEHTVRSAATPKFKILVIKSLNRITIKRNYNFNKDRNP